MSIRRIRNPWVFVVVSAALLLQVSAYGAFPKWAFDGGPNPGPSPQAPTNGQCFDLKESMTKQIIDINACIADFPNLSEAVTGEQWFRYSFGPMAWRMRLDPNSVKILFIGQDGTHIAEAAGRPATAGFGGRAQDLAKYFGVTYSAAFINTFAFTIYGQYAAPDVPYLSNGKSLYTKKIIDNLGWLLSQDPDSPLVQWRNMLIDWIIRNNRESLKMIVVFGGAAHDAAATYIQSAGGEVASKTDPSDLARIQVPEFRHVGAGGNNETAVPYTRSGYDFYASVLKGPNGKINYKKEKPAKDVAKAFAANPSKWLPELAISNQGEKGSGLLTAAQLGGYDIDEGIRVNGQRTKSIKGLKLSDGTEIETDIMVVELPHPTSLSANEMERRGAASEAVADSLKGLKAFLKDTQSDWTIPADDGVTNEFAKGSHYTYGRTSIGPSYYDFGAPASRMVDVSDAVRLDANTIVIGTRDKVKFAIWASKTALEAKPEKFPGQDEMWTARPRGKQSRYVFDPGPPEKYARLMKSNLPEDLADDETPEIVPVTREFKRLKREYDELKKKRQSPPKELLARLEVLMTQLDPSDRRSVNKDYAHYRGTFEKPQVLIVADPDGYDDIITSRALTGSRGQYLQGLMNDLGVGDRYLLIKTAPYAMGLDWVETLDINQKKIPGFFPRTARYREALLGAIQEESGAGLKLILADGKYAAAEVERILGSDSRIVKIERKGRANNSGLKDALKSIQSRVPRYGKSRYSGKMADIPRSHLPYYARIWEGTSGDRVLTTQQRHYAEEAFAEIAPKWATEQRRELSAHEKAGVSKLIQKLDEARLRRPRESVPAYFKRIGN